MAGTTAAGTSCTTARRSWFQPRFPGISRLRSGAVPVHQYAEATGGLVLGSPIDIVLSRHNVVQPDVVFIRHDRRQLINMMKAIRVPPDLVVEVLSRKTEMRDRNRKAELFARFGIPEYWIIDPVKNKIEVYRNVGKTFVLDGAYGETAVEVRSPTLPALVVPAARLFAE